MAIPTVHVEPGPLAPHLAEARDQLAARGAAGALAERRHTLWADDPTELADRLGWLDVAADSEAAWPGWAGDAAGVAADTDEVVVLGMGGSSLFPEVLSSVLGPAPGRPALRVLDTTHPHHVQRVARQLPDGRTLFVAASKSGSTAETRSQLALFRHHVVDPGRFAVITDPGSALEAEAREAGFRHVWHGRPDVGGRFSAASAFGVVPAALLGLDGPGLLADAGEVLDGVGAGGPGLELGALIGAAALAGRDKLVLLLPAELAPFGAWLEQLVAESLGKHGVGVVPVVGGPHLAAPDRLVVVHGEPAELAALIAAGVPAAHLDAATPQRLGALVATWEVATAVAGAVLGINPFDQPDVESAKRAARAALAGDRPPVEEMPLEDLLTQVAPGDHLALCAFVDPGGELPHRLEAVRWALAERYGVATTLGIGPRFLHSTGQLHKGGPASIVAVQVLEPPVDDLEIPGGDATFGQLLVAQADGDLAALHQAGRRAGRVPLAELLAVAG